MRTVGLFAGASLAILAPVALAQAPSFDELVPLIQGGAEAIQGEPRVEEGRVVADDAQSGANYALAQIIEQEDGDGVREIVVPSGFAVVLAATEVTGPTRTSTPRS